MANCGREDQGAQGKFSVVFCFTQGLWIRSGFYQADIKQHVAIQWAPSGNAVVITEILTKIFLAEFHFCVGVWHISSTVC